MPESFKVSAPGKLMLLGEHAVLAGRWCLVCAVNQRMTVSFFPRKDSTILIKSALGQFQTSTDDFKIDKKFRFVLTCIQNFYSGKAGFELDISSDFSANVGLGSSAAVTAAMLGVLAHLNSDFDKDKIFRQGFNVIRIVQGTGSGADLAASVYGGILKYRMKPQSIEHIPGDFPITVAYSGVKTPTTKVIRIVNEKKKQNTELFKRIFDMMDESTELASQAIKEKKWVQFGEILCINQGLMDAIGVNNSALADINFQLRQDKNIFGSKISGSGLGDCVVGLGKFHSESMPYEIIPIEISQKGVTVE